MNEIAPGRMDAATGSGVRETPSCVRVPKSKVKSGAFASYPTGLESCYEHRRKKGKEM